MSSLVIVALPSEDDYIHKISSEKVPHMTLLVLGEDVTKVKNLGKILDFVRHAADISLKRFGMEVDRRGILGPDEADILFFSKDKYGGFKEINEYRSYLLKDNNIRTAYDSTTQFSEWIPHITLGFPTSPAKSDERDYPGITYVTFDRIAIWFGDYEGIEFPLKRYNWNEMPMSDISEQTVKDILAHVGVKGMKWGIRKQSTLTSVGVKNKRKKLKTFGGKGLPAHSDAISARTLGQIGKKSGLKALSNEELQTYSHRLQLEQNVKRLNYNELTPGKKFVATILGRTGSALASEGLNKGTKEVGKKAVKYAMA